MASGPPALARAAAHGGHATRRFSGSIAARISGRSNRAARRAAAVSTSPAATAATAAGPRARAAASSACPPSEVTPSSAPRCAADECTGDDGRDRGRRQLPCQHAHEHTLTNSGSRADRAAARVVMPRAMQPSAVSSAMRQRTVAWRRLGAQRGTRGGEVERVPRERSARHSSAKNPSRRRSYGRRLHRRDRGRRRIGAADAPGARIVWGDARAAA
jgi:hypothetical protein